MSSQKGRKIRVLMAKLGLDSHDRGITVLTALLRDSGMEVIYLGTHQCTEAVINAAIEEDVDVIGLSFLAGDHRALIPEFVEEMKRRNLTHALLLVGGIIPEKDFQTLKEMGVNEIFPSGTRMSEIIHYIEGNIGKPS